MQIFGYNTAKFVPSSKCEVGNTDLSQQCANVETRFS